MLKNNLKIAIRNIFRYKMYSFINIMGLAVGIASSILIFLFVRNELSYDAFHKNADDIYLVQKYRHTALGLKVLNDTWVPLSKKLKNDYTDVKDGVRLFEQDVWIETSDNKKFKEDVTFADPNILTDFTFPLKIGDEITALKDKKSIVISEKIANKYFGNENPIGKSLILDFEDTYVITGVLEKVPQNSTISANIIAPFASVIDENDPKVQNNWNGAFLYTFLKLKKGIEKEKLESQLPAMVKSTWGEEGPNGSKQLELKLLPLKDLHNDENQTRSFAYILLCIAGIIIIIAAVNFMNLSISRSMDRAREIGMRKVLGATKSQLVKQYLGESIFLSFVSLLLAIGISELLLPVMNNLYNLDISEVYFFESSTLIVLISIALLVGIISGVYPAFVLSKFRTIESLSGKLKSSKGGLIFTNALVTLQFALSVILVAGTGIVWSQTNFMKNFNTNFDKSNIVVMPVALSDFADKKTAINKIELFKTELLKNTGITEVSSSMSVPGEVTNSNVFATPENWQSPEPLRMRITANDEDFFNIYNVQFIEGRNFSKEMASDRDDAIIINESAMKAMGWQSAINKKVKIGRTFFNVIGVVKDYNTESLQFEVRPLIHFYRTTESSAPRFLSVKYSGINSSVLFSKLKSAWKNLDPEREFDYFFIDNQYNKLYASQDRMVTVIGYFSMIAIFIASLGLIGLIAFSIVQKRKEIGIRKVLGCSIPGVLLILTKKYLLLIVLANLIALPVSYYLMNQWLKDFAFRVDINFGIMTLAALVVFIAASVTILLQSLKAAMANPVDSIKYE